MRASGTIEDAADRSQQRADDLRRLLWWHQQPPLPFPEEAPGQRPPATALEQALPAGWSRLDDRGWPQRVRDSIDHVVVGPGGVLVVASNNWSGTLTTHGGVLRQNGYLREREVAAVADAALVVSEHVPATYRPHVQAVLCFAREEPVTGSVRDVSLCSTSTLEDLLHARPAVLSTADVAVVASALGQALPTATAPRHDVVLGSPPPVRSPAHTAAAILAAVLLLATLLLVLTGALGGAPVR